MSAVLCLHTTFYESELVLIIDKGGAEEEEEERMETNSHSGKKKNTSHIYLKATFEVLYTKYMRGCGLEPHRPHCVVVLEQDIFILA